MTAAVLKEWLAKVETQNFASLQADAIKQMQKKITEIDASSKSRDAKFCVSQGGKHN